LPQILGEAYRSAKRGRRFWDDFGTIALRIHSRASSAPVQIHSVTPKIACTNILCCNKLQNAPGGLRNRRLQVRFLSRVVSYLFVNPHVAFWADSPVCPENAVFGPSWSVVGQSDPTSGVFVAAVQTWGGLAATLVFGERPQISKARPNNIPKVSDGYSRMDVREYRRLRCRSVCSMRSWSGFDDRAYPRRYRGERKRRESGSRGTRPVPGSQIGALLARSWTSSTVALQIRFS
jgi:hypothetical protein